MNVSCIAGITTYNPDMTRLKFNIDAIVTQVDIVLIVDNASSNISEIEAGFLDYPSVKIVKNKKNMGIAYAMNKIGEFALNNGYDWFLTLDQDSICPTNMIEMYSRYVNENVAIIAPYIDFNTSFISNLFHLKKKEIAKTHEVEIIKYAVSSGQFIQTNAWKKVKGFWEFLFIDYVDQEFCFNVTRNGYSILRVNFVKMQHEPGISVKIFGVQTAKQSAMREYYCARNSRLVYWLYRNEYLDGKRRKPMIVTIKRLANSILVREDTYEKIKAIFKGVIDAYLWKKDSKNLRIPFAVECVGDSDEQL